MSAIGITLVGLHGRLIENSPMLYAIADCGAFDLGVVGEVTCQIAIGPAAFFLQCLGQVPMVESYKRTNFGFEQGVDQAVVIVETFAICCARASRLNARPTDGEAVAVHV